MQSSGSPSETVAPQPSFAEAVRKYFRDFGVLRETRSEYWGIQIVNFIDCTFYFAMLTVASLYLSTDLGMSDTRAGFVIAAFTSATTILLTVSGMLSDWLGIRKSMRLSMIAMLLLRVSVVALTILPDVPKRGVWIALLLVLMAPFMAAIQTIFQAATQRFTTKRSRSAGFNLWYLFMNVGAAAGGASIDIVRLQLKLANVHIFSMGVICAILCLVVAEIMVRDEAQLRGADEEKGDVHDQPKRESPLRILLQVSRESAFFRLVVLIALILGVRAVYTYLYLLMPKYWERTIGADAAIGTLNMINPIGIVIGLILFIPLTNKFKVYNLLVYGAMVSAFALFPMALPWQSYGVSIEAAHYIMAILCMVIVTVGEVLWSPKLNEYTAAIAPKGQEGTYLGLSMIPWFLAKTLVSSLSGPMLTRWSPENVSVGGQEMPLKQALIDDVLGYWQTPSAMWMILGIIAFAGCLGALALRSWLTKRPDKPWIPIEDQVTEREAGIIFLIPAICGLLCATFAGSFLEWLSGVRPAVAGYAGATRAALFSMLPLAMGFFVTALWGLGRWLLYGRRSGVQVVVLGMIAGILWGALVGFVWIVVQIVTGN